MGQFLGRSVLRLTIFFFVFVAILVFQFPVKYHYICVIKICIFASKAVSKELSMQICKFETVKRRLEAIDSQ